MTWRDLMDEARWALEKGELERANILHWAALEKWAWEHVSEKMEQEMIRSGRTIVFQVSLDRQSTTTG